MSDTHCEKERCAEVDAIDDADIMRYARRADVFYYLFHYDVDLFHTSVSLLLLLPFRFFHAIFATI